MLRILVWRATLEILELLKVLGIGLGSDHYYYAFGANLNPDVLKRRNITVYQSLYWRLSNYQLLFDQQGPFKGAGFASVRAKQGDEVWGKVYQINRIDRWRMHCFEAAFAIGKYEIVTVPFGDRTLFFYQTSQPRPGLSPTREYRDKILMGFHAPPSEAAAYVSWLRKLRVLDDPSETHSINLIVKDYSSLGSRLEPVLRVYDNLCLFILAKLILRRGLVFGLKSQSP